MSRYVLSCAGTSVVPFLLCLSPVVLPRKDFICLCCLGRLSWWWQPSATAGQTLERVGRRHGSAVAHGSWVSTLLSEELAQ